MSSGAVAEGMKRMGWTQRPAGLHGLQAAAAIGQMGLVQAWESCFQRRGLHTAQVLLTHDDLSNRKRYLNARSTLRALVGFGVVPVVNENDAVANEELRFGDNDTLAALVANLIEADLLVLLTDQQGFYSADPRRTRMRAWSLCAGRRHVRWTVWPGGGWPLRSGRHADQAACRTPGGQIGCGDRDRLRPRTGCPATPQAGRGYRYPADLLTAAGCRAQALARRAAAGKGRLVLDAGAVRVLRESGAACWRWVSGRCRVISLRGEMVVCVDEQRPRVCARAGKLQCCRGAPDQGTAVQRDRRDTRLCRRGRAGPP